MPSSANSTGNLEIPQANVDGGFLQVLNDRLRRIGTKLATVTTTTTTTTSSSGNAISQATLAVPGTLGVQSDAAPSLTLPSAFQPSQAVVLLKTAPIGASVVVQLFVGGAAWGPQLTASGLSVTTDVSSYPAISANALIRLDIIGCGTTFPGADLTLELR